jgi:hypothetical protein
MKNRKKIFAESSAESAISNFFFIYLLTNAKKFRIFVLGSSNNLWQFVCYTNSVSNLRITTTRQTPPPDGIRAEERPNGSETFHGAFNFSNCSISNLSDNL